MLQTPMLRVQSPPFGGMSAAAMRVMFVLYLTVIVLGIVGWSLIGILGR
jgi:hypothetical protein